MFHFHISDDHPLFRNALIAVINQHFTHAKISESSDLESTINALEQYPDLDLLLLDLSMPGSQDLFGLITIREKFPTIPVAVVSATENEAMISRALGHGASGYIPKSAAVDVLQEAIQALTDGECWIPKDIRLSTATISAEQKSLAAKVAALTPQQYKVLCHLREGWLNKQIAYELEVTEATVKAHITAIFRKLGVSNRTQAVITLSELSMDSSEQSALSATV